MSTTKAGPYSQSAEDRDYRQRALELAVQTVATTKAFTNFQIVHTADLYAKFILDGQVPPVSQLPAGGVVETVEADDPALWEDVPNA